MVMGFNFDSEYFCTVVDMFKKTDIKNDIYEGSGNHLLKLNILGWIPDMAMSRNLKYWYQTLPKSSRIAAMEITRQKNRPSVIQIGGYKHVYDTKYQVLLIIVLFLKDIWSKLQVPEASPRQTFSQLLQKWQWISQNYHM